MRRVVLLAVVAGLAAGCGPNRVPVYPVSGRLTIEGKTPTEGWIAALHLEPAPAGEYPHPLPRARVGPDGRFQFHTYETDDGAPAGTYKISFIYLPDMQDKEDEEFKEDKRDMKAKGDNKSRQLYWPELVQVHPETNELPPFNIK